MSCSLELVSTDGGRLMPGMRWPIEREGRTRIGRRQTNDVVLPSPVISSHHCELRPRDGSLWLTDTGSQGGLYLYNDDAPRRIEQHRLTDGDCFGSGEMVLCFLEEAPPWPEGSEDFIAAIEQHPDDDGHWRVWADFLQERGHPDGIRMAKGAPRGSTEPRTWLGPLGYSQRQGLVSASWAFGFVRRVSLATAPQALAEWLLPHLLSLPYGRFVREVVLETSMREKWPGENDAAITQLVQLLTEHARPRLLESVLVGPQPMAETHPKAWAQLQARYPRLR